MSDIETKNDKQPASIYKEYTDGKWQETGAALPDELGLHIFINGTELATLMCSPEKLNPLVVGFLTSEGIITGPEEITYLRVCIPDATAEVKLDREIKMPDRRVITSGCGGGTAFDMSSGMPPVTTTLVLTPEQVFQTVHLLQTSGKGTHKGMHASLLSNGREQVAGAEDIGRHNTMDKILGECLMNDISTADTILATTGRISSEMLLKTARMHIPVVASLNSATKQAAVLGEKLGITVIGYVRASRMSVYSHPERISQK